MPTSTRMPRFSGSTFLIDVVAYDLLTKFVASLDEEMKHASEIAKLRRDRP